LLFTVGIAVAFTVVAAAPSSRCSTAHDQLNRA